MATTTEGVTVRVQPRFAGDQSDPENGHWVWHYHIRIENNSGMTLQLIDRAWIIIDGHGGRRDVMGEHVIGRRVRWLGWLATACMALPVIGLALTWKS